MRTLLRKLGLYVLTAWAALTLNFAIPRLMPGNAVDGFLARLHGAGRITQSSIDALSVAFGLDTHRSLPSQYLHYLGNVATLHFGVSLTYFPESVGSVIRGSLPWTLALVGATTVIAYLIGTVLGIVAGWRRGTWLDSVTPVSAFLSSMPYFWFGAIVIAVLAIQLRLFPYSGGYSPSDEIGFNLPFIRSAVEHALLPGLTIVVSSIGGWVLGMRNMMLTTMSEDYVTVARAKGLRERDIMFRYAARNAMLPNVASFALSLGFVVSGAILTEVVFSYPGIGDVLFQAILNRDYPLMQGVFVVITFAVLLANLAADVCYVVLDPRVRRAG